MSYVQDIFQEIFTPQSPKRGYCLSSLKNWTSNFTFNFSLTKIKNQAYIGEEAYAFGRESFKRHASHTTVTNVTCSSRSSASTLFLHLFYSAVQHYLRTFTPSTTGGSGLEIPSLEWCPWLDARNVLRGVYSGRGARSTVENPRKHWRSENAVADRISKRFLKITFSAGLLLIKEKQYNDASS